MPNDSSRPTSACPISYALEIFGDRWTLLVLRDLMLKECQRYGELLASPEGIATNVLADRLKRLEQRGLISKRKDPLDARQIIYSPTDAAIALVPMLLEMIAWSAQHGGNKFETKMAKRFRANRDKCIADVQKSIRARRAKS